MNNKRILIFNVNWIGDVLFSTAAIRNVRYNFPESFIACAIPSRCYPVLKDNPYLDEVIIYDEKDRHKNILSKLEFAKFLKGKRFDTVYLLHRSFTRALLCRIADIPERIGHKTAKRAFILTKKISPPKRDSVHRIDYYLNVLEKAGLRIQDRCLDFFVSDEEQAFVDKFLSEQAIGEDHLLIGLNPGGNWMPKRWPKEYWAHLAQRLSKDMRAKIIITGSFADAPVVSSIQGLMQDKPISTCGIFNLKHLAALCKRLKIFITADTGPLHIANAVRCPNIIALFGPTSPSITGPNPAANVSVIQKPVGCRIPCYKRRCEDNRCMKAIAVEDVMDKIKQLEVR